MAEYNSQNTRASQSSGGDPRTGFGASGAPKKGLPGWMKLGFLAATAIGAGVMVAELTREEATPDIGGGYTDDGNVQFGPNSREAKAYQQLVTDGRVAAGESVIRPSNDLMTIYEVSPVNADTGAFLGVEYEDVTGEINDRDLNESLIPADHLTRSFSLVLDRLAAMTSAFDPEINPKFDPQIGMIKHVDYNNHNFVYHMFENDQGYGEIKIASQDYYAANRALVDEAVQQNNDLADSPIRFYDDRPWDQLQSKVSDLCATHEKCNI